MTPAAKDIALRAVYGRSCALALTANGMEDPDAGRKPIVFGDPQGDERRFVANLGTVTFGPWPRNARAELDGWALYDAGTGQLLDSGRFPDERRRKPLATDRWEFAPGDVRMGML